jgi:hypothetical protein
MLVMIGVFDVIHGAVTQEWVFEFDTTAWGRIQLILGVILIASGVGIFSAATWPPDVIVSSPDAHRTEAAIRPGK